MLGFYHRRIILALIINHRGDICHSFLGFNNANQLQTDKKSIVSVTVLADRRICSPFSNCKVFALLGACAFGITQICGIDFPAIFSELLVNQYPCFSFGQLHVLGSSNSLLRTLALAFL